MEPITSLDALMGVILPVITGWLSLHAYNGIKQLSEKVVALGAPIHTVASALLAFALGVLASRVGVAPESLIPSGPLSADAVNGVLTVLVSAGLFRAQKRGEKSE